jgi:phosphoribosylaminoimidazolecarboxamide formyltransferase/IMP cyclohydrolase
MLRPIRRALLSVSDKTGLVEFARGLYGTHGVELVATGGTKKLLAEAGLPVRDVAELTGFPEILDGRVKTLHPAIFAGLLAKRSSPEHLATLVEHNLPEIDLVVCNLYPFEETVAREGVTEAEAIENIDIGGPTMIRAAAKNFEAVAVLVDPNLYDTFLATLAKHDGQTPREVRAVLAGVAFRRITDYDNAISEFFLNEADDDELAELDDLDAVDDSGWDKVLDPVMVLEKPLRYGENPHQKAALYRDELPDYPCVVTARQLHGKELSYNNILDLDSALNLAREFAGPTAVVVKHNNPCGVGTAATLAEAFVLAWAGDPLSAFGGIVAVNATLDVATADALMTGERFVECVVAPDFEPEALAKLQGWKKNVRLLRTGPLTGSPAGFDYRRVDGGMLVQSRDIEADDFAAWKVVTTRPPTPTELAALQFTWTVCKHVKSNAIVLGHGAAGTSHVVGVGAGQMSRVVSVEIAVRKAGDRATGSVLASDAFFPFPDNVELAAAAGVTAIVQPGGSVKDAESIAACDKYGIAMCTTGVRHFRH